MALNAMSMITHHRLFATWTLALGLAACGGGDGATAPALTITSNVAGAAIGPITFSFIFSDEVGASFTVDNIAVSAGTMGAFTKLSAVRYTLVVLPPAGATGSLSLSVAANAFASLAGTPGAASASVSQAYDTLSPILALGSSAAGAVARSAVTLSFSFSEDVGNSFTIDDVLVSFTNGVGLKGAFTRISGTQASLVVSPPVGAAGTINIRVAEGAFSDLAGNANPRFYFGAQQYDTR